MRRAASNSSASAEIRISGALMMPATGRDTSSPVATTRVRRSSSVTMPTSSPDGAFTSTALDRERVMAAAAARIGVSSPHAATVSLDDDTGRVGRSCVVCTSDSSRDRVSSVVL